MSLIASMVKFASKLHPRAKKTWAEFSVPQMCKYVAAWSLKLAEYFFGLSGDVDVANKERSLLRKFMIY